MKNVGVPDTPLASALRTSSAIARSVPAPAQVLREAIEVEAEVGGVPVEVARRQLVLVGEQPVVHLPEAALRARGLGRLGRDLRVGVDVVERQVAAQL